MPEEVRFFARLGGYGVIIAIVYWIVSREPIGTVVLVGFGAGMGFVSVMLALAVRRTGRGRVTEPLWRLPALPSREAEEGAFIDEEARLPGASFAPLEFGLGIGLAALGLVLGPWLFLAAAAPLAVGGRDWLRGVVEEHRAVAGGDRDGAH